MSFLKQILLQDLLPVLSFGNFEDKIRGYSDSIMQNLSQSITNVACSTTDEDPDGCRDDSYALVLKFVAIAAILTTGACGVAIPLVGKNRQFLRTDSNLFVITKAFAAGVILATGFVHMLPDATSALTNSCLPSIPWSKFPFSGFIAMMAALVTLLAEFVGTQYHEKKQGKQSHIVSESVILREEARGYSGKVFGEEEGGTMHIVGMHAHAAEHGHSHARKEGACVGQPRDNSHGHSHSHGIRSEDDEGGARHIIVSQVLELGIVSHSVIIGLSLGVSHSPCTVRPLIGALSVHQFFEGFALGGCISQANFRTLKSTLMACFFALTTPLAIAVGIGISSIYNANSPRALVVEGILDSISTGILVYMALVDLIAADFLSKRMSCNLRLQVVSYFTLFLGALLMSSLAIWS